LFSAIMLAYFSIIIACLTLALLIIIIYRLRRIIRLVATLTRTMRIGEVQQKPAKIRKRYIVFQVISKKSFDQRTVEDALRRAFRSLYGFKGLLQADPRLVYYDEKLNRGVIRIPHTYKYQTLAVLHTIREIDKDKVIILPVKTTGTIKKAREIVFSSQH
jgi:ribonuclease P/MRP protein subunit POP5